MATSRDRSKTTGRADAGNDGRSNGTTSSASNEDGTGKATRSRTTAAASRSTDGKTTRAAAVTRATDGKTTRTTTATETTTRAKATRTGRRPARASAASATGATARARLGSRTKTKTKRPTDTRSADMPLAEPTATVPADDATLAASNARRALSPDMPRVAWLRTQLQQMEDRQRDRLIKVGQLTLIAIVFITFVLQNAQGVNVHFLLFSLNIRLIWVIFGCAILGGFAGYLIGRPDKSLRSLMPQKEKRPGRSTNRTNRTARV